MKISQKILVTISLFGLLLISCEIINSPNADLQSQADGITSLSLDSNSITSFDLKDEDETGAEVSVSRDYNDEDDKTTFEFIVTNLISTSGNQSIQFFNLELPACIDRENLTFSPELGRKGSLNDEGISWNQTIAAPPSGGSSANNSRTYSLTINGNIPAGEVNAEAVRGGGSGQIFAGMILGPVCSSISTDLTFSGSVYIDANENDFKDPEEYGLDNITVSLYAFSGEEETFIESIITGETGEFSFNVSVPSGDFRIKVPANKVDNIYYQATVTSKDFTGVTDDVEDIDFGYVLDIDKIVLDLLNGAIEKNSKSTQYWAFQLQHVAVNQQQVEENPNIDFTRATMVELLKRIEGLLPIVEVPFQFDGEGESKINDALSILRGQKYDDPELSELMKELLTAELNVANELGALTPEGEINNPFNRAILIFGEAIACNALDTCPEGEVESHGSPMMGNLIVGGTDGLTSSAILSDGTTVLRAFNGTGGIGSN